MTSTSLETLGWTEHFQLAHTEACERLGIALIPARVVADFGQDLRVLGEFGDERAALSGRLRFEDEVRPAVGDFVGLIGVPGSYTIAELLPRKTWLARQAAGEKTGVQLIGANLDLVFVVTSFNEDLSINRLERYVVAVKEGGAHPVIVVNKRDVVTQAEADAIVAQIQGRLADVELHATSAYDNENIDLVRSMIAPGATASFVGSSGVGKSSIVNLLVGEDLQAVREVREGDAKGRHTTTHRELFVLEGGGLVLDTPGMREFQLWDEAIVDAFEDITELAALCRFTNCGHETEPGCAVLSAVESGELNAARLESFRMLAREAEALVVRQDEALKRAQAREFQRTVKEAKRLKRRGKKP